MLDELKSLDESLQVEDLDLRAEPNDKLDFFKSFDAFQFHLEGHRSERLGATIRCEDRKHNPLPPSEHNEIQELHQTSLC